jgi:hypothetical protein
MPGPLLRANPVARTPGWSVLAVTPLLDATERALHTCRTGGPDGLRICLRCRVSVFSFSWIVPRSRALIAPVKLEDELVQRSGVHGHRPGAGAPNQCAAVDA